MSREVRCTLTLLLFSLAVVGCAEEDKATLMGPEQTVGGASQYAAFVASLPSKESALQQLSQSYVSRIPDGRVVSTAYYAEEESTEALQEALAQQRFKIQQLGGQILYQYNNEKLPALLVAVPDATVDSLVRNSEVLGLVLSRNVPLDGDWKNYSYWNVNQAGHGFGSVSETGGYLRAGIIDTGVECGHPDLPCPVGFSFTPRGPYYEDPCNHGTGVYSVWRAIRGTGYSYPYGYAPSAYAYMYRADIRQDQYGRCYIGSGMAAAAVDQATFQDHLLAISMSFSDTAQMPDLEVSLGMARAAGIFLVASAGNTEVNEMRYPAAYSSTMGISGLQCSGSLWIGGTYSRCFGHLRRWTGSTYGSWVDLAAIARTVFVDHANGSAFFANGTSYAAPAVAAAGILVMERWPGSRNKIDAIMNHLKHTAYTGTPYYNPTHMGAGVLDVAAAIALDPCSWQECQGKIEPWP